MNRDDQMAAEHHQRELERREQDELLANDPDYIEWLKHLDELSKEKRQ